MDGILLIDKPPGWTSHDVVAKVRGVLKAQTGQKVKVGHTGTLDPMATGLLILVVGKYTKQAEQFSKMNKTYEAEVTLGYTSTTADKEGELTKKSARQPSQKEVDDVLSTFLGEIEQTPPAFSAIKVNGQRAYKAARAGKTVEIEPRKVTIYEIKDVNYEYPILKFTAKVSSGTYIRTLAEDIGQKLATGAYLSSLRRTQVGQLDISESVTLDKISFNKLQRYYLP
jgi:tRNA pseudouridine55 synthase